MPWLDRLILSMFQVWCHGATILVVERDPYLTYIWMTSERQLLTVKTSGSTINRGRCFLW